MTAPDVDICDELERNINDPSIHLIVRAAADLRQTREELAAARKLLDAWSDGVDGTLAEDTRTFLDALAKRGGT
jgi:hypothetical protein